MVVVAAVVAEDSAVDLVAAEGSAGVPAEVEAVAPNQTMEHLAENKLRKYF